MGTKNAAVKDKPPATAGGSDFIPIRFDIQARDGEARTGILETRRGAIETPVFMPIGTAGTVKGTRFEALEADDLDARIQSGNPQADEILGGGFPANSINILMGQPGTGKTIFATREPRRVSNENAPVRLSSAQTRIAQKMAISKTRVVLYIYFTQARGLTLGLQRRGANQLKLRRRILMKRMLSPRPLQAIVGRRVEMKTIFERIEFNPESSQIIIHYKLFDR